MTPLPPPWGAGGLTIWRLDVAAYAPCWASGEGAYRYGGRWNSREKRVVYGSLDPATAILEVAVHKGFLVLDTVAHVMTQAALTIGVTPRIVRPDDVPNPHWLVPGWPSAGQQVFGDRLIADHKIVLIPSVVSRHSWNLLIDADYISQVCTSARQESFALDTRLHRPGQT
jgi:RES domain-containing protein